MQYIDLRIKNRDESSDRSFLATITDESVVDRDGDTVSIEGLSLKNYQSNPIVLFNHNSENPIARCISIERKGSLLEARFQFPPKGEIFICDKYYGLIKNGILNTVSIGFFTQKAIPTATGVKVISSELAEISIVSIPSNTGAVIKSKQIIEEVKNKPIEEAPVTADVVPEVEAEPVFSCPLNVEKERMRLRLLKLNA